MTKAAASTADVVLIGLGGACGIVAHVLTKAGLDVVALEAGGRVDEKMMTLDEIRNDVQAWMSAPKSAHEIPTFREPGADSSAPTAWPTLMVNAVGGSTTHYPGLSARLLPWNFTARSSLTERYGADAIPAESTLVDWPLSYDDLAPHYDRVEQTIGVAGQAVNPFEGTRACDYPLPPLRRSGWNSLMDDAARTLGWHPFPGPAAINSVPHDGRPACTYCGFCTGSGCYRNAKGSVDQNVIPLAEATGRLRVLTGARASRIDVDSAGLARGVTFVKDGRKQFQAARVVVLGTFTYENVRLLFLSTSKAHPNGLGNTNDQLGRHFVAHATPFTYGRFRGRRLNLYNGLWAQATCLEDWNGDNFDHTGLGFVGGGMLTAAQELKPIAAASMPPPPGVPRFGSAWKRWLHENGQSVGMVNGQFDALPYESNRLDLDPGAVDRDGVPRIRITYRQYENEERGCAFLSERAADWLEAAGADEIWQHGTVIEARHCYGGTRMGDDAATSVVDRFGLCHDTPNLAVVGASTFPTAGGLNPTLTLQALSWRTADRIVENLR